MRTAFASGLAVAGIGVGTLVMPPVAAALMELVGWRSAHLLIGIGIGAAIAGAGLSSQDPTPVLEED